MIEEKFYPEKEVIFLFRALKNISVMMNAPTVLVTLIISINDYHSCVLVINSYLFEVFSEDLICYVNYNCYMVSEKIECVEIFFSRI